MHEWVTKISTGSQVHISCVPCCPKIVVLNHKLTPHCFVEFFLLLEQSVSQMTIFHLLMTKTYENSRFRNFSLIQKIIEQ